MSYGTSISRFLTQSAVESFARANLKGLVIMAKLAISNVYTRFVAARILREIAEQARE